MSITSISSDYIDRGIKQKFDQKLIMVGRLGYFSPSECDRIVESAMRLPQEPGLIKGHEDFASGDFRRNRIAWIHRDPEFNWMITRLQEAVELLNDKYYRFDISGFEPIQFSIYDNIGDFYESHIDINLDCDMMRKISVIVQLSDENDYEGGNLEVFSTNSEYAPAPRQRGSVLAFPSFLVHRVTPITKGKRLSLVAWTVGPNFK